MSFITDSPELMELLVRKGLVKIAQQAAVSQEDVDALKVVVNNLEKSLATPTGAYTPGPKAGVEGEQDISLTSQDMENLAAFVQFLSRNKVLVDGKRIAYAADEKVQDPNYPLYKLQGEGSLALANRNEPVTYGFYLNADLLTKYLNTLQAHAAENPNPILNKQLASMIEQANDQLDTKIGAYQAPEKVLPDNTVLDNVPDQFVNIQSSGYGGDVSLTYGDVKNAQAFNKWLSDHTIAWRTTVEGKSVPVYANNPSFDRCGVLNILHYRASQKVNTATDAAAKEAATIYVRQIGAIAGQTGCQLQGYEGQAGGAGQSGSPSDALKQQQAIQHLVGILPLQVSDIDFTRIKNFLEQYKELHRNNMATAVAQAEDYMNKASQLTVSNMTNFPVRGMTANDLVAWSMPPEPGQATRSRGSARALADYLEYLVRAVYSVVKDLQVIYGARMSAGHPEVDTALQQQVGGNSITFGSSVAYANIEDIRAARARLPQVGA